MTKAIIMFIDGKISFLSAVLYSISATMVLSITAGCQNKQVSTAPSPTAPANTAVSTDATGSSDEAAKRFLAVLEAQTFDQRISYVNAHQAESYQVTQSKDSAITKKYSVLMTPPQTAPPQSTSR